MTELNTTGKTTVNNEADEEITLLTVEQMAKFLQITEGALKDWTKVEENPCPCYRYKSRILRFDKAEVMQWFKEQTKIWNKS